MRRLLTDAKFHSDYMDELLPRLNAMRVRIPPPRCALRCALALTQHTPLAAQQKRYAEVRATYKRMILTVCAVLFALVAALHLALLYRPELLRARLTERLIKEMWTASPVFNYLQARAWPTPRGCGAAVVRMSEADARTRLSRLLACLRRLATCRRARRAGPPLPRRRGASMSCEALRRGPQSAYSPLFV